MNFTDKARNIVVDHFNSQQHNVLDTIRLEDTALVWFSKTLQNWKALIITNRRDSKYYEVSYNGNKKETYLDEYQKIQNKIIKD